MKTLLRALLVFSAVALRATVPSSTAWLQATLSTNPQTITVPFVFINSSDILVLDSKASPPVVLIQNSDYSVAGGGGATGSVSMIAGGTNAVQVGDVITISRKVPLTQTINFTNTGPLTPAMIGQGLDKLTEITQQLNLVGANSLQFQPDEQTSGVLARNARANNLLGFDSAGAVKYYASPGAGGVGTVTNVATGTGLTGGPITATGTIALANTAVSPGSYATANITVDQQGRLTAASSGAAVTNIVTGTGLNGGPITSTGTISIANTAVTAGSYTTANITVNAQGQITAASNGLPDVQIYGVGTATWTKPANAKVVFIYLVSAGGGGGSGRRGAAGTNRGGGGGGGGGAMYISSLPASILGATETVTVGAGAAGGGAVTGNSTDGNAGASGGVTKFGSWAQSGQGNPGGGGSTSGGAGGVIPTAQWPGQAGTAGVVTGQASSPSPTYIPFGGGAGAGGGGITSGDVAGDQSLTSGGSGSGASRATPISGGAGGYAGNTAGQNGSSATTGEPTGAGGGGGGMASTTAVGGSGGSGGFPGGGGGGGGASANGNNSGAGGAGGDGLAIIISLF